MKSGSLGADRNVPSSFRPETRLRERDRPLAPKDRAPSSPGGARPRPVLSLAQSCTSVRCSHPLLTAGVSVPSGHTAPRTGRLDPAQNVLLVGLGGREVQEQRAGSLGVCGGPPRAAPLLRSYTAEGSRALSQARTDRGSALEAGDRRERPFGGGGSGVTRGRGPGFSGSESPNGMSSEAVSLHVLSVRPAHDRRASSRNFC